MLPPCDWSGVRKRREDSTFKPGPYARLFSLVKNLTVVGHAEVNLGSETVEFPATLLWQNIANFLAKSFFAIKGLIK